MSVYNFANSVVAGAAGQSSTGFYPKTIEGSLRFNSGDAPYISYTNGTATNGKKCTLSFWIKKNEIAGSALDPAPRFIFAYSGVGNQFHSQWGDGATSPGDQWVISPGEQSSNQGARMTDASLRDPSAWYHCVWKYNSESGSEESTLYVNGVQQSSSSYTTAPVTNQVTSLTKSGTEVKIGYINSSSPDFQLAELFIIDGTAHDADAFGETKNGVWVPKNITASDFIMGNNGVYLNFQDDTEVEAFNTVLWRSNGATQSVTGVGFSPDLVWGKERTSTSNHAFFDTVRGPNRGIFSNNTSVEVYNAQYLQSFDSDGFTLGSDGTLNQSGQNNVAWCWDAGANNAVTGHSSVAYIGDGGTQTVKGLPFTPDLIWIKNRDRDVAHGIFDTVRGFGVSGGTNTAIGSNRTDAEGNGNGNVTGTVANGFKLAPGSSGSLPHTLTNQSGEDYIAWCWDAGDGDPVSNTDGSITSTVKASTTNGFSIVDFTTTGGSQTVGHGLATAPNMVIVKARDASGSWFVQHTSLASTQLLRLETTDAAFTSNNLDSTFPTSSVFSINLGAGNNIAYCFHDVTGKQKFDTYSGTGSDVTVNTGFRVGWLMIKRTDSGDQWLIKDSSRSPFNPLSGDNLYADASTAEGGGSSTAVEFTSTGFKVTGTDSMVNSNGGTYIYAAFAGSYSDYITDFNTDGSIDSRVKANDTTGFSIVSYTGTGANATWGHGLSSAPAWVIVKDRGNAENWIVYHKDSYDDTTDPAKEFLRLNGTERSNVESTMWNNTAPTSTTVSVGTHTSTNGLNDNFIAYCWAEKTGYSKFGSYTGNGSTTGPTITTGFKPSFVLIKKTSDTSNWSILDSTRSTSNDRQKVIWPNQSSAESDNVAYAIEFTDTGFQLKTSTGSLNETSGEYIYAAFADTREAAFWLDQSSNDNDWQPVNLDHNDTVADSPTDNFATLNPLSVPSSPSRTFSDGNLRFDATTNNAKALGTILLPTSGQWYWEATQLGGTTTATIGVADANYNNTTTGRIGYRNDALKIDETGTTSNYGATYQSGDTIGVAFDADADTLTFYKNGVSQGTAFTGMAARSDNGLVPFVQAYTTTPFEFNFGQQPFKYDLPE